MTGSMPRACLALAGGIVVAGVIGFWICLPDPLFTAPTSAVLEARNGALLGARIATDGQWRFPMRDTVPSKYAAAVIAYEDKRFYRHPGVDPIATLRAIVSNVKRRRIVSGGSTLTMQVIRLARDHRDRTYGEKLVEMILALRLELGRSKAEILALYAANAPFGGNVVGLEAAAWRYFGRSADDLSWAEASMLAVLPNNPALIHPARNRDRLKEKRNGLLERLYRRGLLDEGTLRAALLEPLPEAPRPLPQLAPHLLETLTNSDPGGGPQRHRFATTLSLPVQRRVLAAVDRHGALLRGMGVENLAALVVDNQTFEVVAYVGNNGWSSHGLTGRAIDLIHRPRSTGSVLKPLLYARMLDAGEIVPATLIPDLPTQFAGFIPENYDRTFRGAVPARLALARSLNVPAVRMLKRHGVDRFYDYLVAAGLTTLNRPPRDYGLTLILGGAEGTLWDLTGVYANLAHLATRRPGDATELHRATVLLGGETATGRGAGLSVGAAWLTLEALFEVVRPGIDEAWRSFAGSQRIAWKTGTSYGQRDAWAIGSSARYTVGVWAGNATGEGRSGLTGIGAAAPVLFDIFGSLDAAEWPERPEFALRRIDVCRDDGYLVNAGCEAVPSWAPVDSHFERTTPHHRIVHLDRTGNWRVNGRCEPVSEMTHQSWFVLPAGQEYYYRRHHPEYRPLPQLRADCRQYAGADEREDPVDLLYPAPGTRVYIPVELNGKRGRVVFEAAHRDPDAELFWHLDDRYLGLTRTFHEQAVYVGPGQHTVTVVDRDGNRATREFEVLGGERVGTAGRDSDRVR